MTMKVKVLIFLLSLTSILLLLKNLYFSDCLMYTHKSFPTGETLLVRRLNHSVEPFLSPQSRLSGEAFDWWRNIQSERRDFSYYQDTVNKLLEMFPPTPDSRKVGSGKRRTCSVVGNSANLKGSGYGPLIDYQDVVIRMNFGRVKGFEADVGTKTTHRVMYPESATDLDDKTHLVLFAFKIQDMEWLIKAFTTGFYGHSYARIKPRISVNKNLVMVVNPAFMKYSHEIWLERVGSYPSTGFMTLIISLHICDEVRVFGFGPDSNGSWSHYFETLRNKHFRTGVHPGYHEYAVLERLGRERSVKFYKGL